jgi:hypothetical protein
MRCRWVLVAQIANHAIQRAKQIMLLQDSKRGYGGMHMGAFALAPPASIRAGQGRISALWSPPEVQDGELLLVGPALQRHACLKPCRPHQRHQLCTAGAWGGPKCWAAARPRPQVSGASCVRMGHRRKRRVAIPAAQRCRLLRVCPPAPPFQPLPSAGLLATSTAGCRQPRRSTAHGASGRSRLLALRDVVPLLLLPRCCPHSPPSGSFSCTATRNISPRGDSRLGTSGSRRSTTARPRAPPAQAAARPPRATSSSGVGT